MQLEDFIKIILVGASLSTGAILGTLRNKILSSKNVGILHFGFFILSVILFISTIIGVLVFWKTIFDDSGNYNYYAIVVTAIAILSSIILFFVAKKYLVVKDVYKTSELDPIINQFTTIADKTSIRLFGGDLNFFGNTPEEMIQNNQYNHLKSLGFRSVLIICESPQDSIQRIRYGKILTDIPNTELRFYNPDSADLRIRGRMIEVNGVTKLLMYRKIKPKTYEAIERNSGESDGVLYTNIWNLIWSLSNQVSKKDIDKYKSLV